MINRGSEWNRWNFHINTPGTAKNNQYKGNDEKDVWDKFYNTIIDYIGDKIDQLRNIEALGITDINVN